MGLFNDGSMNEFWSRDHAEPVACSATSCMYNTAYQCVSPTLAEIGPDGRCIHFKMRPIKGKQRPQHSVIYKHEGD